MRIAIVCQSYPPMMSGAALFSERLAKHFSACGHEVLVLAASDRADPYRVNLPNLRVERFRSFHNPLRVRQRFALWPHQQIVRCLADFAPDVVHLHDPLQFAISCLSYSRPHKIPVVLTIHAIPMFVSASFEFNNGIRENVEGGLWRYGQWVLKRCSRTVTVTQTVAEEIFAHTGINPQVISCGVELSVFKPDSTGLDQEAALRARLGIPELAPIILHVGRLDTDKQVDKVIQAASIAMQRSQAHLLVVGDGTEKAHLEQLCARLGLAGRSHFPGFITVKDGLPALYRMSTVFVTASEIETQGLVLLEAAACALPIVAVQATCMHEIVHDGQNGFLAPSGDIAGMAERITSLIENPTRAREMGKIGRLIVENHAAEKTSAAYEELYRTIIREARMTSSPKAAVPGRAARPGESN